jgi:preprotein translocase subunit SecE
MAITRKKDEIPKDFDDAFAASEPSAAPLLLESERSSVAPAEPGLGGVGSLQEEFDASEGSTVASQLGVRKYVLAGYFVAGLLFAYVVSRFISSVWATLANKEWFARAIPLLASVPDDTKATYATILAGILSLVLVFRTYGRPSMRAWGDDVAAELARCKWPTKKEVTNYTTVVIIASALATSYLALLDRFFSFVTNLVYGNAS